MNMQFRDRPEPASSVSVKTAIADCDIHPARATNDRTLSVSGQALARASRDLRQACLSGHDGRPALSEGAAERLAPRRLAAGRRPAGLVAVLHAEAASRSQQCRARRAQSAQHRAGPAQPGSGAARSARRSTTGRSRNGPARTTRLKGSIVVANEDGPAAAAEIRKRAGDRNFVQVLLLSRNVEPLGQRRYWPIYEAAQEVGPAGRRPCLRLRRQSDHRLGLAELLHRGDGRPFAVPADRAGEPRARRRVRAAIRN